MFDDISGLPAQKIDKSSFDCAGSNWGLSPSRLVLLLISSIMCFALSLSVFWIYPWSPHCRIGVFVAKDERGFELGREVTLGQLALSSDHELHICLESDSLTWSHSEPSVCGK